ILRCARQTALEGLWSSRCAVKRPIFPTKRNDEQVVSQANQAGVSGSKGSKPPLGLITTECPSPAYSTNANTCACDGRCGWLLLVRPRLLRRLLVAFEVTAARLRVVEAGSARWENWWVRSASCACSAASWAGSARRATNTSRRSS